MRKRKVDDDHESTDRWLVSYADFITLLFTFFVALYALSSMDTAKMEKFSGSLNQSFKVIDEPIALYDGKNREIVKDVRKILKDVPGVSVKSEPRGIVVTFSDTVLFTSGSAAVKQEASGMLDELSKFIVTLPGRIAIEGHTDNVPMKGGKFTSNWELSTGRAASILHLFISKGLDPDKFSIAGYAEFRPVAPNDTEENRTKNRRVELVISLPKNVSG
ncbi:MAG TPA: flagellar motor protein MotB [Syntrophales bacterium]|nr:flagellar motor protein MotB [Syntrophales bacterium]